jgi:hypothetical protein
MTNVNLKAASMAGSVAGIAYAATSELDNRISGRDLDDLKLLGRTFVADQTRAKRLGLLIHLFNSVSLAALFPKLRRYLPGTGVVQGITYGTVENTVLYPIAALENYHPGVRNGEIDRYFSLKAYLWSIPRHIAYGATLGFLYDRFARQ